MCGITGFFAGAPVPTERWFADAVHCVAHRGPDTENAWVPGATGRQPVDELDPANASAAALGFARLAIIDLSEASDQPLVEPGRAALAFNGEIYNYIELRAELEALGWHFTTSGDGEVLLKGYLEWGIDVLPRLNGMFAMAIHDEARNSLLLARDRFGEKPLFVADWHGGVAFASEVKQLARYPGLAISIDPMAVRNYLVTGRPYTGFSSWFTGISQLQPGTWLRLDADGRTEGRYFDLFADVAAIEPERTADAWAGRFSAAWERSIELRLRSDVPVGTSLSSGVDSAAVLAEAAAIGHQRYHAFTLRYDDARDEGPAASELAASVGFSWHPVWGRGDEFAATWDRMTWHHETPVESGSVFGQWKVFEAAHAEGIRVVLDGQGSDEVLGGYHKFYASHVRSRIKAVGPLAILDVLRFGRHVGIGPLADQARRRLRRSPSLLSGGASAGISVSSGPRLTGLDEMRHLDIGVWSLPNLLAFADRNAMAHSIETRLPFLDPDVAVLSMAMPASVLFRDGWTKWPLRRHLAHRGAPGPAWRRGKRWFDLPSDDWLATSLRPAIDALRDDPHPAWAEFVESNELSETVTALAAAPRAGGSDELMRLLALERFFRVWS